MVLYSGQRVAWVAWVAWVARPMPRPPNLSWELLDPRFGYQRDKLPGRALVRLFVKNEG